MFQPSDTCLYCGKSTKGRGDKKFCDSICKNRYYHLPRKHRNVNLVQLFETYPSIDFLRQDTLREEQPINKKPS